MAGFSISSKTGGVEELTVAKTKKAVAKAKKSTRKLYSVCVCFLVEDVVKSAEYYRDVLGFKFDRYWGEPPCFAMMGRDGVEFFLSGGPKGSVRPNRVAHPDFPWDAYVRCLDGDGLYKELKAKGAEITRPPEVTFYEMKEFEVKDCNGYVICFGQDTSGKG